MKVLGFSCVVNNVLPGSNGGGGRGRTMFFFFFGVRPICVSWFAWEERNMNMVTQPTHQGKTMDSI